MLSLKKNTIAIALVEHLGDIIACEPIPRFLRKLFPDHPLVWVTRREYAPLLTQHPALSAVHAVDCLGEWIDLVENQYYAHYFDLHFDGRYCTKTRKQIAHKNHRNGITSDNYYLHGPILPTFCMATGLPPLVDAPRLYWDSGCATRVDALSLPAQYMVLHSQSNEAARNWLPQKWSQLAELISTDFNLPLIELGLAPSINSSHVTTRLCGVLSLHESAEVLRRASCFVGVDSGLAHMAVALQIPAVVMAGQYRQFKAYFPYTGSFAHSPALRYLANREGPASAISVQEAYSAVSALLTQICGFSAIK